MNDIMTIIIALVIWDAVKWVLKGIFGIFNFLDYVEGSKKTREIYKES